MATAFYDLASRQVSWYEVHEFVAPLLDQVGSWPLAGSPAWQQLDDHDPIKLAALYDAAQHHILRVDTAQAALAEASRAIAGSADWSQISRLTRRDSGVYIPRQSKEVA